MFGSSLRLIPVAAFLFAAFSLAAPYNDYPDPTMQANYDPSYGTQGDTYGSMGGGAFAPQPSYGVPPAGPVGAYPQRPRGIANRLRTFATKYLRPTLSKVPGVRRLLGNSRYGAQPAQYGQYAGGAPQYGGY